MRQSAALVHFQDRASCTESLEVIDLWNLFHRHPRLPNALYHPHLLNALYQLKGQEMTIW